TAVGDPLVDRHRRSAVDEAQRPGDEVVVVDGNAGGERAGDGDAVAAGFDGDDVGELERHHLGVDQVVAVVAHPGDPQLGRQLRRRVEVRGAAIAEVAG